MNFNDPIENRLGLDRPEHEDDARDSEPVLLTEWRRAQYPRFGDVVAMARKVMAPDAVKAAAERAAQDKQRTWDQR